MVGDRGGAPATRVTGVLEPAAPTRESRATNGIVGNAGRWAVLAVALLTAAVSCEQPPQRELLNSERIEQAFGSFGIEVLVNGPAERVSRLYSTHEGLEICRTFAVVLYPDDPAPALAREHAAIVAGGSIGSTFAGAGWTVRKAHRYFGTIASTAGLRDLMRIEDAGPLGVHVYTLSVARQDVEHEYAMIAEIHHPDYLSLVDLERVYGAGVDLPTAPDRETERVLERVAARLP